MIRFGWLALALVVGCSGKDKDSGDEPLSPDLMMSDENSYGYTGSLEISSTAVAAGSDATVDWCGLTTDIRGRSVDPNTVDRLVLIEVALSAEEVMTAIEANSLTQEDTVTQWIFQNEQINGCTANLSDFSILANDFNPANFVESSNTWLLSATNFADGQFDFLMPKIVVPTSGEANTDIVYTDTCAVLTADADLTGPKPLRTSASFDSYTLDWSGVTKDVYGQDFDDELGNRVLIGKVDLPSVSDVEEIFLRVDTEASELYRLNEVDGLPVVFGETSADLMLATDDAGNAFGGFTTDGIWLVGIECTTCTSPAPLLLSVVEVEK